MADNNNPIKYSDLVSPDDSITKLITQLDQLSDAYMNTLKNVRSEAISVRTALSGVSGATEEGRKTIKSATTETDRLARSARELAIAESENAKRLSELKQAQREANEVTKIAERLNQSTENSLSTLSNTIKETSVSNQSLYRSINEVKNTNYDAYILRNKEGLVNFSNATNQAYSDLARLNSLEDTITKRFESGSITLDEYTTQIENIQIASTNTQKALERFSGNKNNVSLVDAEAINLFNTTSEEVRTLSLTLSELQLEQQRTRESLSSLNKEFKNGTINEEEYIKQKAVLNNALGEQSDSIKNVNRELSLNRRYISESETAYNRVSAEYGLIKIRLNSMTVAQREATEEGRNLVAESDSLFEEMKRLQAQTGKTSLNVGNYSDAAKALTTQIENQTKQLALMRLEGKQGSEEYRRLSQETATLRDAVRDATKEVSNMASDTSTLDSVLGAASAASGGFAAFTGAMELFGGASEDVEEAQRKLQAAIAITTGVQAIQNAVQRQSALMLGISRIQMAALTKAQIYNRLITIQGTKATIGATVAQRAFNLVAAANPYVLLALALITVVGALVLFASNTNKAAEQQTRLNQAQKQWLDYLQLESTEMNRVSNERIAQLNRELGIARARNAGLSETRKIEDEILRERRRAHSQSVGFYAQELNDLEANRLKLEDLNRTLLNLNDSKSRGQDTIYIDVNLDGRVEKVEIDEAIEAIQGQIDNVGRAVEIAVNLRTEGADLDAEIKTQAAQRQNEAREAERTETDILRRAEDARIALIRNSFEQQRVQRQAANSRSIADIQLQLRTENNLTTRARNALNEQIVSLREQLAIDMIDIANQQRAAELSSERLTQDAILVLMNDGYDKQRERLKVQYERQIEDLQIRLDTERGLTERQSEELLNQQLLIQQQYTKELSQLNDEITIEQMQKEADRTQLRLDAVREGSEEEINLRIQLLQQQRAIELAQNRQLSQDLRQSENDINAKYDADVLKQTTELNNQRSLMLFDQLQSLESSEFDLLRNSEERKTRFRLEQERARLQKVLELNESAGIKMSDNEVETIRNTIQRINNEIEKSQKDERSKDIYGLFGLNLDDDQKEAISSSVSFALEQLQYFLDAKVAAADQAVEASNKEVDASQRRLDAELESRANGYASNVVQAQKDLDLARRTQERALREQERAQRAQESIQNIQQIGNLVTASSLIWSQLGFPFALPAIAVMWGSFAASKIRAAQLTRTNSNNNTETYGDGTVELLQGGSHQSGNDVDLGSKPDGTRRRAEGGEFFAVFNKRNSRKYRRIIPDVINALNNGTFEKKYMSAYDGVNSLSLTLKSDNLDITDLKNDVREIKEQNKFNSFVDGSGNTIYIYKNLKRKIKK